MKVLFTSDLHIGKKLNGFPFLDFQKEVLDQYINIIKGNNVKHLVIAGDIFQNSQPTHEAFMVFENFLNTLTSELDIKVIYISGNHDSYYRITYGKDLFKDNIIIGELQESGICTYEVSNVVYYLLPFEHFTRYRIRKNTQVYSFNEMYLDIFKDVEIDNSKTNIFVGHGYYTHQNTFLSHDESVRRLSIGTAEMVDISILDDFDVCMFGHLHQAQKVGNELFRYSGTPLKYSFSEVNHNKTVCLFDLSDKNNLSYELIDLNQPIDLISLNEDFETLISKDYYNKLDLNMYFKLHIKTDTLGTKVSRLNKIYKNIVEVSYEPASNNLSVIDTKKIKSLDYTDLFKHFYKESTDSEISNEELNILEGFIGELNENK